MTELPTYTSVFRLQRRLYAIYDWELPVPISLFEAGVFVATAALLLVVGKLTGIRPTAGSAWFFLVPPGFAAHLSRRPIADHKRPGSWLYAHTRYLVEPRVLHRLRESRSPQRQLVSVSCWRDMRGA